MENYILPHPPAREAALPQPRAALQNASDRINQSPVKLAPIRNAKGGPSKEEVAEIRRRAEELYDDLQKPSPYLGRSGQAALDFFEKRATKPATVAPKAPSAPSKAAPAPAKATAAKKRKAGPETTLEEDIAAYKQNLDIEVDGIYMDMSCGQVRSRINQVLDGGIMTKGQFCTAIGSSNKSLNTFLQKRGNDGSNTESYGNAWAWFKQRELAGLKMPDVKKRQKAEAAAAAAGGSAGPSTGPASKKAKTAAATDLPDLSSIHLDGMETDTVPVFDSCDEIRKKISAHLKTPGLTQAQFCRDLFAQLQAPTCKGIQSKQLNDFRGKKGPIAGCTSAVFYAAYVYFERLRLAKGKPKSNHRKEMEDIHPGGLDLERDGRSGYWVGPGESISMDSYGRLNVHRR